MFRGTPYSNRLIQKKQQQRSLNYHRTQLRKIRPLSIPPPQTFDPIFINNGKKQYQNQVKFTQIQRQNRILLEKITSINRHNKRNSYSDSWQTQRTNRSLNSTFRKKQLEEIQVENAKLLRRLQEKKPNYNTEKLNLEWRRQKNIRKNMSHYPTSMDRKNNHNGIYLNSIRTGRNSKMEAMESYRIKVINGINFLITIKLNAKSLTITGDSQQTKGIKVIQINRNEAIEFIEDQCQGKIQLLYDRLRYDREQQALYLVSNQVTLDQVLKNQKNNQKVSQQDENQSNPEQQQQTKEKSGGQVVKNQRNQGQQEDKKEEILDEKDNHSQKQQKNNQNKQKTQQIDKNINKQQPPKNPPQQKPTNLTPNPNQHAK